MRRRPLRKKRVLRKRKAPGAIKKIVRREIARNTENKTNTAYNLNFPIRSVAHASVASQCFQVNPSAALMPIVQGTAQNQRVGNVIKLKKLTIKGTLVPQPYSASTNPYPQPVQVKIWVFTDKLSTPNALLTPVATGGWFQLGGSSVGFTNDLADTWLPVNEDRYKVFATRTVKLGPSISGGLSADPNVQGTAQFWSNNDFKLNCNFSIDLLPHAIKQQKYNDNSADPSCRSLYVMFIPSLAGGGQADNTVTLANLAWVVNCEYEDA